ncbi:MAG: aspartate/tyrosine/aromatic aminotransferase [Micrococcales bacterium]|nr:MAG: aspartate/tyrosine/aromatic aminotransferase [Micrococcales bacterium]PIE26410.1 MAG: aspartate/tyrosine/aromatic aminotransferase [Micrococcales bacterium]
MDGTDILVDAAGRQIDIAARVLDGIDQQTLHHMPAGKHNSIAWLVWHSARQQDLQLSMLTGLEQLWSAGDWGPRMGIDRPATEIGFGDGVEDVARLQVADVAALSEYLAETVRALQEYVRSLSTADLDYVINASWDPPVTRGIRLVSMIDDAVQHLGQAAYVRGLAADWSIGY